MKALFVCTGNSCRSVMAEFLFNRRAREAGLDGWEARSCGLGAQPHFPVPGGVRKALAGHGIAEVEHRPRLVAGPLIEWADAVYAMSRDHLSALRELYPQHRGKMHLFSEDAGLEEEDVADPIGRPDETYAECARLIERGIRRIVRIYAPANPRP